MEKLWNEVYRCRRGIYYDLAVFCGEKSLPEMSNENKNRGGTPGVGRRDDRKYA